MLKLLITSGPYVGRRAYVVVDAPCFRLLDLPLELRHAIYKMVFEGSGRISVTGNVLKSAKRRYHCWALACIEQKLKANPVPEQREGLELSKRLHHAHLERGVEKGAARDMVRDMARRPITTKNYSILLVSRGISKEAREYLYRDRHFTFNGVQIMLDWLEAIGSCKKYLTHLTCEKSGHRLFPACYRQLTKVPRLQYFKINLPISVCATLDQHIRMHYEDLKHYLLARNADEAESLSRLSRIHFAIGKEQLGILDANRVPIKEMTPELEESCKEIIRGKLRKHFA